MNTSVKRWMSWEGGVDLIAMTRDGLEQPDVIVHMARVVHTPAGSAASGLILLPGDGGQPKLAGFISEDEKVGRYFGPHIFAGTPFENAPVLSGKIEVEIAAPQVARVRVAVEEYSIVSELRKLGELQRADRAPGAFPFHDNSLEARADEVTLTINGERLDLAGIAVAVWAPCGFYSR